MMRRFGLLGKTLKHSFSKNYFAKKFADEGIHDCSYENFELPSIDQFPQLIKIYPDLNGINVTIPYKEEILPFLHHTTDMVKEIGACNCIKFKNGILFGHNTDAPAFRDSLGKNLQPHHKRALVLGSGGASKAVQYALKNLKIGFIVVSRNKATGHVSYDDVDRQMLETHHVIVNTTPLGLYPNVDDAPPLRYDLVSPQHLLYDLVYNPPKTKFLEQGEKQGAQVISGYEMLVGQAEESWRIWNET
jgi:shikimate dehydrogenase